MSHPLHAAAAPLALAACLIAHPARAAADTDTIIVTATSAIDAAENAVARIPGGADVVPAEAYRDRLAVSLRDTLAFSPGVYTQPRFGQEVRLSVRGSGISRGFHMRGLMLFQDGIPINLADNNGDFQELDPQVFSHIAVYRGANALRLGSSTLGGGIDAVTPTGRSAPGFAVGVDGGAFDTVRGKIAAGFATPRGDGWMALTADRSEGDRDHADRRSLRFNGNVGLMLADGVETRVYASLNNLNQKLPGALTRAQALASPRMANAASVAGDQARDVDSIRLQSRTTIDLGRATLAFGGFFNAKDLFHPIFEVIDQKSEDRGLFARGQWAGEIGGLPVEASIGLTARFGTTQARQFRNLSGRRGARTQDLTQGARTIDSYGELRVAPADGFWLIAGGVHTHGRRTIDNRLFPTRSGRFSDDRFAPKFGALWQAAPGVQVYANYSRSIELPGYSELSQNNFAGTLVGFVPLDAQRAWTAEIGTRGQSGIARWDISLYRAALRGEMLQFSNGDGSGVPAATFNADRTLHQGIEAALTLDLAPWARLRQAYQLNDFCFRDDAAYGDNRLPVVAKHLYRADLRLGTDRLSISPNVEWAPEGAWADYRNMVRTPDYVLFGVTAEAQAAEGVMLFVDARNIANRKAIGDISAVVQATAASAIYYPVERRAVYGGVRARF